MRLNDIFLGGGVGGGGQKGGKRVLTDLRT